uniref:Glycosyltransferase n=1 Tax=Roseihalotalea indica TaxID=2867963 RepID=A0AA49JK01_9BACT|nr:glycosyltransferase [Tunicatimonas sp. TK19036]
MIEQYPMLVTVYITNFNYGNFIQQAIDSVLQQTLQDFEIIIIDDGSTDHSKEIIEEYRNHSQVSIIYQKNNGLNITNNIAMRAAKGKYLMRLDADDFLEPEAIAAMSAILENDDELGLVFPDYYYVDADGARTGQEKRHNFEKEVSLYDQPAHGACTMIRLAFLKTLGGYNESFTCQDGYDLWIKFIMHHKVTNINRPLFSYRQHGNNLTTNEEKILNTRKQIKELFVNEHLRSLNTLAVIPVRSTFIGDINWPLHVINGQSVLERKVADCAQSQKIKTIVISTSDQAILDHCQQWVDRYENTFVIKRPKAFAQTNESLIKTLEQAISFVEDEGILVEAIMSVSLEYLFVAPDVMDDAINTLVLFNSDSVLSVRPDNQTYYQHNGHSLKPILDHEKFTKLEREALYKGAGGIVVSTLENFKKTKQLASGKISHIVVDQKTAFGVFSKLDFTLVDTLVKAS